MRRSNLHLLEKLHWLSDRRRFELFPPFFIMRVKIEEMAENWSCARIRLPLNWVSANAAGNMFGGYQASLADPIPALACLKRFPGYRVVTKKLDVDFIRVGNSDLMLHFDFDEGQFHEIEQELNENGRATPTFEMKFVREDRKVCTRILNTVAIRPEGYIAPIEHHDDD